MIENKKLSLVGWTFFAGLIAAIIIGVIFYWYLPGHKQVKEYIPLTLFENGMYVHYTLNGSEVERAPLATSSEAYTVRYPNGAGLTVNEKGLEWVPAGEGARITLVERAGLSQDAWSIAPDGTSAVLFNDVTASFDVFAIDYQGASVSYVGSISRPELPTYTVSVGFAASKYIVLRTGNPESFLVYKVHDGKIKNAYTAGLKVVSQ